MPNIQQLEPRNAFHRAQARIAESIDSLRVERPPHNDSVAIAIGTVADAIAAMNTTMQSLDRNETDNVVALYAIGFGPNGGVSEHSETGRWISEAWRSLNPGTAKQPTICDISVLKGKNPSRFEQALRKARSDSSDNFVSALSDADISRFLRLAGDVCSKIGPPPSSDPDPESATA